MCLLNQWKFYRNNWHTQGSRHKNCSLGKRRAKNEWFWITLDTALSRCTHKHVWCIFKSKQFANCDTGRNWRFGMRCRRDSILNWLLAKRFRSTCSHCTVTVCTVLQAVFCCCRHSQSHALHIRKQYARKCVIVYSLKRPTEKLCFNYESFAFLVFDSASSLSINGCLEYANLPKINWLQLQKNQMCNVGFQLL